MSEFISRNAVTLFVGGLWLITLLSVNQTSFISSVLLVDPVAAQTELPSKNNTLQMEVQNTGSSEITGTILRIDNETISVETDEGVKTVILSSNVSLTRNGTSAVVSDLEISDEVTILQSDVGNVLSVTATEAEPENSMQFGIPLLLLGILVIGAFIFFRKKMGGQDDKPEVGETKSENS